MHKIFEQDWETAEPSTEMGEVSASAAKVAKKVAKAVSKDLPPLAPVLDVVAQELGQDPETLRLHAEDLQVAIKGAVKEAVKEVVADAVKGARP